MLSSTLLAFFNKFAPTAGLGTELGKTKNTLRCNYTFAVQGGAIGLIKLLDPEGNLAILPDDAVITQVYIDTKVTPTSSDAATIGIGANTAVDLKAQTAIATYAAGSVIAGIPVGTGATMVKLTAQRQITITIADFALLSGQFDVFVDYVLGQ